MIEIIPNWHPVFVHFPIALLSMATVFFVAAHFVTKTEIQEQLKTLAYWNLGSGTGFAIITAIAGWFAYNSVAHDTPSHEAMTEHRNIALATVAVYIAMSFWAWRLYKKNKTAPAIFTVVSVLAFSMLVSTGWHGSEAVYRYGLGVMSLPQSEGAGHAHDHGTGHDTDTASDHHESMPAETPKSEVKEVVPADSHHDHSQHKHEH